MTQHIVLATLNPGKQREFQAMAGTRLTFEPLSHFTQIAPDETGLSFIENAILKARHASKLANRPALADDSGLMVDALGGQPGIYSARFAGDHGDEANMIALLKALEDVPHNDRTARYVCVLAYVAHHEDPLPQLFYGYLEGRIALERSGDEGFGYDPIFWIDALGCTAASMASEQKNAMSHRAQAFHAWMAHLSS